MTMHIKKIAQAGCGCLHVSWAADEAERPCATMTSEEASVLSRAECIQGESVKKRKNLLTHCCVGTQGRILS